MQAPAPARNLTRVVYVVRRFDQPARAARRRATRQLKAHRIAPRPASGKLRPVVRAQTIKYNTKVRLGRGFTTQELREAKIGLKYAPTIGIAVDRRRHNDSQESLQLNVARLKEYQSRLIVVPKQGKASKGKGKKVSVSDAVAAGQNNAAGVVQDSKRRKARKITKDEKAKSAVTEVRVARADARLQGIRTKKFKEKQEAAAAKAKAGGGGDE